MRVFIAIEVPEKIKKELEKIQELFNEDIANITFVETSKFHLTLKFFGEISNVKLERVRSRLEGFSFKDFDLELSSLGVFPNRNYVSVLWVGLKPERKVQELKKKIEENLRDMFGVDNKFRAHLTIGRVKSILDKDRFFEILDGSEVGGRFNVDSFKLVKSTLVGKGHEYETLEEFK